MTAKTRLLFLFFLLFLASARLEAQGKIPVWIDTDPSVERGGHEVDDGFALIQAFHSPELDIRGVSVVFGNADLPKAWQIGKDIVERFGPAGLRVYRGAAGSDELGKPTDASEALTLALQQAPLYILAIGPVTNVATVLRLHPELAKNVAQIVAVAGRRRGQHFVVSPRQAHAFRDFNFEMDPAAFQVLLDSRVAIALAPWEISSKVWIRRGDLEQLRRGGPEARYLFEPASDWLAWWQKNIGVDGFNPFDTLAVGYLTSPALIHCQKAGAKIEYAPDDTAPKETAKSKPYLLASFEPTSSRALLYCFEAGAQFKNDLMGRVLSHLEEKGSHAARKK